VLRNFAVKVTCWYGRTDCRSIVIDIASALNWAGRAAASRSMATPRRGQEECEFMESPLEWIGFEDRVRQRRAERTAEARDFPVRRMGAVPNDRPGLPEDAATARSRKDFALARSSDPPPALQRAHDGDHAASAPRPRSPCGHRPARRPLAGRRHRGVPRARDPQRAVDREAGPGPARQGPA